jgi:hypothetical protein
MTIKFNCPHCKRALNVKDNLAGRKAACPVCKKPITIPAPVSAPLDLEAFAAAALADQDAPAPAKPVGTVDFVCPMCDENIKVSADLAGKQTPCPSCRRIIKVPLPEKKGPTDWRKVDVRAPAGARRDNEPAPEGAWGSTSASTVSRQALQEARAVPVVRQRLTRAQLIKRGVWAAAGLAVIAVGALWMVNTLAKGRQARALDTALKYLADNQAKLSPEAAAELHRAAGEYFIRANSAKDARDHFQEALALLPADAAAPNERDFVLTDLALTWIDLGSDDKREVNDGVRLKWEDTLRDVRQPLQNLRAPEARLRAFRAVTAKLIAKGQAPAAALLASQLSPDQEAAEALAVVGLEMLRGNQTQAAETLANGALEKAAVPVPAANEEQAKGGPAAPSLISLFVALGKADKAAKVVAVPPSGEPDPVARTGYAEGWARLDKWDTARSVANRPGAPAARLHALTAVAAVAVDKDQAEAARATLEDAYKALGELGNRPVSPWLLARLVRVSAQAGLGEQADRLARVIPDPSLAGRAQLDLLRDRLSRTTAPVEDGLGQTVAKDTPAQGVAVEALARHNAQFGSSGDVQKSAAGLEPETVRPFGFLGLALGIQDSGR